MEEHIDSKTQQQKLLNAMKNRPMGVNSFLATYQMGIKQAPTRIRELKEQGYNIISHVNKDRSVNWILANTSYRPPKKGKTEKPKVYHVFDEKRQIYLIVDAATYWRMQQPEQQKLV